MVVEKIEKIISWIGRLVYLNILCLLFSLAVISVVPSIFALANVVKQLLDKKEPPSVFKSFNMNFKENFWRSYLFFLPSVSVLYLIWVDIKILSIADHAVVMTFYYALILIEILLFAVISFAIYLNAVNKLSLKNSFIVGFSLMVKSFPLTILLLISYLFLILIFTFQTGLLMLVCLSLPVFIICLISRQACDTLTGS